MNAKNAKRKKCETKAKTFNETVAMDSKQWLTSPNKRFLHLVDHATRFSVSCIVKNKRKECMINKFSSTGLYCLVIPKSF